MVDFKGNIRDFISKVPKGCIFDAHAVIQYIIQEHPNDYRKFYNVFPVNFFHSWVSRVINSFVKDNVIERCKEKCYSLNSKNNFSENSCWKKL